MSETDFIPGLKKDKMHAPLKTILFFCRGGDIAHKLYTSVKSRAINNYCPAFQPKIIWQKITVYLQQRESLLYCLCKLFLQKKTIEEIDIFIFGAKKIHSFLL